MEQGCVQSSLFLEDLAMSKLLAVALQFGTDEEGATMVEYGLLVALIALVALGAVKTVGTGLSTLFTNVGTSL